MLDRMGRLIRRGDRVTIGTRLEGIVVFSIDTDEFSEEFPKADWDYLGHGIMVQTDAAGLVHLPESDEDTLILGQISN